MQLGKEQNVRLVPRTNVSMPAVLSATAPGNRDLAPMPGNRDFSLGNRDLAPLGSGSGVQDHNRDGALTGVVGSLTTTR